MADTLTYNMEAMQLHFAERHKPLELLQFDMPKKHDDEDELVNPVAIRDRAKAAMVQYRMERGFSQREFAPMLRVGIKSYDKYESPFPDKKTQKIRNVPIIVIARFCRLSGISLEWIMFGKKYAKIQKTG